MKLKVKLTKKSEAQGGRWGPLLSIETGSGEVVEGVVEADIKASFQGTVLVLTVRDFTIEAEEEK